jgi:hypothetical protein
VNKNFIVSNIKGGFGNQLFQYATGLSVALRNNAVFMIDLSFFNNKDFQNAFRLNLLNLTYEIAEQEHYVHLKNSNSKRPFFYRGINKLKLRNKYNKKTHIFDSESFKPSKKIINATAPAYIEGWCTKEIYFKDYKSDLIKAFRPNFNLSHQASLLLDEITKVNSIAIHVRRGDYVNNTIFYNLDEHYYNNAISYLEQNENNLDYYLFSDDIDWCKKNIKLCKPINFINLKSINDNSSYKDIEEFYLMKNCKHNIIANSSFSWWAAYLNENPNKIVIAPIIWYKDMFYQKSLEKYSFIPKDWIIL